MFLLLLLLSCMNYLLLCNKLSQNIIAKTINIQCDTVSMTQETGEPLSWVPLAQCLLWSCTPPVGQGCSYLKIGLGRRICFQDHSRGCHSFRSHGLWTAGHCSWSPCVDTSSRWLAAWQLASPRVSDPREGEGKRSKGECSRWKPQALCCLISEGSSHCSCHILFLTCESVSAACLHGEALQRGRDAEGGGHLGSSKSLPATASMVSSPPDSQR